ncbi:hypothetical protein GJAV_G00255180 [Gymnothorax javanicus]|nr:hypothetical protein GJAV_G00255180 [Gymnothorax javanicus]
MEGDESMECEPEVHPSPDHIDSLSLVISTEEEESQRLSDSGRHSTGANGAINGNSMDEATDPATPLCSPGTSYWSVSEGPDFPYLLSPVPKPGLPPPPSRRKLSQPRKERASRGGVSRIPGRDHRRYYHDYWRSEYLMDFDARRHGMICMVCGSSLATLKLSTIKRHIRQKHPDSLLWSAADKQMILSGWESHLSLGGGQGTAQAGCGEDGPEQDGVLACVRRSAGKRKPAAPKRQRSSVGSAGGGKKEPAAPPPVTPDASTETLERYLNDSLQSWFRKELLMEYDGGRSQLMCLVCGRELPSLHLEHIKRHVLDVHPNSVVYSPEEKDSILQTWAKRQEYDPLRTDVPIKSEPGAADGETQTLEFLNLKQENVESVRIGGPGQGTEAQLQGPRPRGRPPSTPLPQRWRLEYLIGRGPGGRGLRCMVCSEPMPIGKVSSFRKHTRERHPETAGLNRAERHALADAWDREFAPLPLSLPPPATPSGGEVLQIREGKNQTNIKKEAPQNTPNTLADRGKTATPSKAAEQSSGWTDKGASGGGTWREGTTTKVKSKSTARRRTHYPGKDQRRNYQARWCVEYLMDYDCRRHGLICMVCGATLATLKVSTIKRHIQHVHPGSLGYSSAQRQRAALDYSQTVFRLVHSDSCLCAARRLDRDEGLFLPWGAGT